MTREPVDSEAIKSMGYDEDNQIAEVEIRKTRRVYQYFNVPVEDYLVLRDANSIGEYYNKVFKQKFPEYKEVTEEYVS